MSWDDDRSPKPSKDLNKSAPTLEKKHGKKTKYIQDKKSMEELKTDKKYCEIEDIAK